MKNKMMNLKSNLEGLEKFLEHMNVLTENMLDDMDGGKPYNNDYDFKLTIGDTTITLGNNADIYEHLERLIKDEISYLKY